MTVKPRPNVIANSKFGPIIINSLDQFIGQSIIQLGYWDENKISLLAKLAEFKLQNKNRIIFYDVGANIGTHTLALSKILNDQIEIRAFEAQPAVHNMICGTIAINNLDNVTIHLNAVSDVSKETILVELPDYGKPNNFGGFELVKPFNSDNMNMIKSSRSVAIETITIDSFSEPVDLIKMDIEGMEASALRGAVRTVESSRPICLIEIAKSNPNEINEFFLARNYDVFLSGGDAIFAPKELGITFGAGS